MVDHVVVATQLWVLVGQCVEAVRTLGHDLLHAHAIEGLDILHGQHLENVFVAGATGRVTGAHFRRAKDRKRKSSPLHKHCHSPRNLFVLVVKGPGTTDPVEVVGVEWVSTVEDFNAF